MKKRILSLVIVMVMIISFMPVIARAATSGTCGENLTWTLDSNGTLTISGTGAMEDHYYSSDVPWYSGKDKIKTVDIKNGVTTIGERAFSNYRSLTSVTIPDSVTTIRGRVFVGCDSLRSVIIPNSVTTIGEHAFSGCRGLRSVSIGNSVVIIGDGVFNRCESLTSITIPNSVTEIGDGAFSSCDSLTDVYYGGSEEQWKAIDIGGYNSELTSATIHYNSQGSDKPIVTMSYDNGILTIKTPRALGADFMAAYYDNKGALIECRRIELSLGIGTNNISIDGLTTGANVKFMLWENMRPLCESLTWE